MAECLPEVTMPAFLSRGSESQEEKLDDCNQVEQYLRKPMLLDKETKPKSGTKLSLLTRRMKALMDEYVEWQNSSPEVLSVRSDVLKALGKEELRKVKNDLEIALAMVQVKNKQLEEDLERERQWYVKQENTLTRIEEEAKIQASRNSLSDAVVHDQKKKILQLRRYKEEIWTALGKFLEEQFPLPDKGGSSKRQKKPSEQPDVKLITMKKILELLISKLVETPHEPYIEVNDSFWPPYIELLLRYGIALRHPEDPNRLRLESFHM